MYDPLDAGIAGAVIVQCKAVAHADQLVDILEHDLADMLKVCLGNLQIDFAGVNPVFFLQCRDFLRQTALHALGNGEVDLDAGKAERIQIMLGNEAEHLIQHRIPDRDDIALGLCRRDEDGR